MDNMIVNAEKYLGAGLDEKREVIDYYNENCIQLVKPNRRYEMKYSDEWCAAFVSAMAHKAGLWETEFPFEVSVRQMSLLAKSRGRYLKGANDCRQGDLVIFDWLGDGGYDHVGVLVSFTDDTITTIEGNIKDTVNYRTIKRHSRVVKAIIRVGSEDPDTGGYDQIKTLARLVLSGVYGTGEARKKSLGRNYEAVQRMVNSLLAE